jgi:hypothetical protein
MSAQVVYQGPLSGPDLRLRYGFDGWQDPIHEVKIEPIAAGWPTTEPIALNGHLTLDCAVIDGRQWDNNQEADYRLWVGFEPIDAHLHVNGWGIGELGLPSLQRAMASAGIGQGIMSWIENSALDGINWDTTGLLPLVWVRPGETSLDEVRAPRRWRCRTQAPSDGR